ncbi:arginyltransferase [Alkalilimnicola ehrlichii]|uniref:Aspartate/glutamate leucyltransferase n=1 Tax=Alkalilimnicola ehrlichii TaxID=351052 RepID=A0A3E0X238_9GAMM|nr:arginyltransferase [Alkalilimnicola ehrlichii]RFA28375.1 arginyltransferase [Alkalilimnicola ehrlichii]RFA38560.1 arginyltransferase [Alkalilimnicola ehrlichii]
MDKPNGHYRQLSVYATGQHSCAYLPERTARTLFLDPRESINAATYDALMKQGFRRSGEYVYRPNCPACQACQSLRIPVDAFSQSRRHRRCIKRNAQVTVHGVAAEFRDEHFALYQRYIDTRHGGSEMDGLDPQQYLEFLTADWSDTVFYEFRDQGRLLAVAVVDCLPNSLSAVYTFYDPAEVGRGLGNLAILWLIEEAKRTRRRYVYLGYWIAESDKMRYKSDFRPHDIHVNGRWLRVD